MARQLNIHAPTKRWAGRSKAWQAANVASSCLLYGMAALMVASVAGEAAAACSGCVGAYVDDSGAYVLRVQPRVGGLSKAHAAQDAWPAAACCTAWSH
jgi:hypothetical protein